MARLDITFGRPALVAVRDAARRGDLRALAGALSNGVTTAEDRTDRVMVAVDILTERTGAGVPPGLDEWVRAAPGDPTALLVRGGVEVARAWAVRGSGLARETQPQRLHDFVAILGRAEELCRAAAQADAADPTPWTYLLTMARGQRVGPDEILRRRAELAARAPEHFYGHYVAIPALGPMWGGSVELMYEQVGKWTAGARPGSLLPALVFVAHIERWRPDSRKSDPFLRGEDVRAQAHHASELLPMRPCETPSEFVAHNFAAGWYRLSREPGRAHAHFKLLRGYATEYPWAYLGMANANTTLAVFRGHKLNASLRLPF